MKTKPQIRKSAEAKIVSSSIDRDIYDRIEEIRFEVRNQLIDRDVRYTPTRSEVIAVVLREGLAQKNRVLDRLIRRMTP